MDRGADSASFDKLYAVAMGRQLRIDLQEHGRL